jgi:hypothetical protein
MQFLAQVFVLTLNIFGSAALASSPSTLNEAVDFLEWLETHTKDFASCQPKKIADVFVLCDGTRVPRAELKSLLAQSKAEVILELKKKGIQVRVVATGDASLSSAMDLHGKYLPPERTILIRDSASVGSLIHEYIHFLQSENDQKVFGKMYKKERNRIQKNLVEFIDSRNSDPKKLTKEGLQGVLIASQALRGFGPWQDLIDERGIFQLYILHGSDLGVASEDIALAKKNMGFICKNPKLAPHLKCGI